MSIMSPKAAALIKNAAFLFTIVVFGNFVIAAQQGIITGKWSAKLDDASKETLNVKMSPDNLSTARKDGGTVITGSKTDRTSNVVSIGHNGSTISFQKNELSGASFNSSGTVNFSVTREPGTFRFDGMANNGQAEGNFTFTPNYSFVDSMRSRGFNVVGKNNNVDVSLEESLYVAALFNISTMMADDLKAANLGDLDYGDLVKASIFKVNGEYASSIRAAGLTEVNMDQLVKGRIFKIQPEDVSSIFNAGLQIKDFDDLVQYKIFKVTPQYLNELKAEGLSDLTREDVVKLSIFKIDAAFVRQARNEDPNITVKKIVNKKLGVREN